MATAPSITPSSAQQPDLRSFIVCDRLPEGCVAYPVTDEANAPHLRPGDIAIIDPADCEAQIGELFVVQWNSGNTDIVETWQRPIRAIRGLSGDGIDTIGWFAGASARARSPEEVEYRLTKGKPVGWVDGPYATDGPHAGALNKKLRGKVVGILEPIFSEPVRIAA